MKKKPRSPLTRHLVAEMDLMWDIIEKTDEVGDCWIWNCSTTKRGYPQLKIRGCGCKFVRPQVFLMNGGKLNPRQPVDVTCDERKCVNPAHLKASSASEIAKKAAKRGAFSGKARAAKIAAARRGKAKLTIEQAREIRMSQESGPVLAKRYGVNKSAINGIKAGTRWKDYTNPFSALIASNDNQSKRFA